MKILVVFISILSILFLVNNANGFLIAQSPLETYHGSDVILIGKITSLEKTGNFTETYHYGIQVEEYIKGKITNSTISATASAYSVPSPPKFEIGDRVLLLLDDENGTYTISPNSFKTIHGCSSHEMLGFWKFPDEPFPQDTRSEFQVNRACLGPLVQIGQESTFFSPLMQFKSGIRSEQISCKEGTVLVIKSDNNIPACIRPETADKLVKQGWEPGPINNIQTDFHHVYYHDDKIDFTIGFTGFVKNCDTPHVTIFDSNHNVTWKGNSLVTLCDPEMGLYPVYVNQTYKLSDGLGGPITINQAGDYVLQVSLYDQILNFNFTVIEEPKYKQEMKTSSNPQIEISPTNQKNF